MSRFAFLKAYFTPGREIVTLAVRALDGVFKGKVEDLYTSQKALVVRSGREGYWSDDEVVAEARAQLEEKGAVLIDLCPHDVPVDEACGACTPEIPVAIDVTGAKL